MAHGTKYTEKQLEQLARRLGSTPLGGDADTVVIESGDPDRTAVLSIRLPSTVISQLKVAADKRNTGATMLARELIIAGLAQDVADRGADADLGTIEIADLLAFAVAHSRSARPSAPRKRGGIKATPARAAAKTSARSNASVTQTRRPKPSR